jgi:hypothetical protein
MGPRRSPTPTRSNLRTRRWPRNVDWASRARLHGCHRHRPPRPLERGFPPPPSSSG